MQRNYLYLQDIVKGRYGRKIAYVNLEQIVSHKDVLDALVQGTNALNTNRAVISYLWRYKNGDQPILYREKLVRDDIVNKVVENHAYEIVQYNVATTYGEPIQYVSTRDDETINKNVDILNRKVSSAFKLQRNVQQGEWKSAVGTSFLGLQRTHRKGKPFRILALSPMETVVVYSSVTYEPIMAIQSLKDADDHSYYMCYTETKQYKVVDSKVVEERVHAYSGIPIVEVPNNQDRLSDIEIVITLLDAINTMQSNRMDGIEQFIQSWIKFVNCEVDEEQFQKMKTMGALVVKSNNGTGNKADVDVMSTELNQQQSQIAKDDLWDNTLTILAIPTKQGNTGGDTQGAVELRNGWDFAKQRAKLKDAYVVEAETQFAELILNELRIDGQDLGLTTEDFLVNIPHSPQDNMSVKANVLTLLLQAGIHPAIAIKVCGLWNDPENVYLLSKPYLDVLYKTIDDVIAEIPDADEQTAKATQIKQQAEENQNPASNLRKRIEDAIAGNN